MQQFERDPIRTGHALKQPGAGHWLTLRAIQIVLISLATFRSMEILRLHSGYDAIGWLIPWIALAAMLLLMPVLWRLAWQRFGRAAPMWANTAVLAASTWAALTVIAWMILTITVIVTD